MQEVQERERELVLQRGVQCLRLCICDVCNVVHRLESLELQWDRGRVVLEQQLVVSGWSRGCNAVVQCCVVVMQVGFRSRVELAEQAVVAAEEMRRQQLCAADERARSEAEATERQWEEKLRGDGGEG